MKNNTYKILIIIAVLALISLFLLLVLKKDYGFDKNTFEKIFQDQSQEQILNADSTPLAPVNKTINNVDYLVSQLPVGVFGGTFTESTIGDPKSFNPYNSNDASTSEVSEIMYDGLTQTDPASGKVIPKLAKNFEIKDDNKTYIVYLRKGVKWSDGVEITSKDVYFTYNTIIFQGFGEGSTRDVMTIDGKLPQVEIIDKYTVKFTTPKPFAPFLRNLSAPIMPEHVFKKATDKGNEFFLTFQGIDTNPSDLVISGAFKLSSYIPSQRIIFERNPNYYLINKKNQSLPYIDKWILLVSPDTNNQTLKFESGETDVLSIQGALLNRYRQLKKHGDFDIYNLGSTTNTTFVLFNLNNRKDKSGKFYVNPIKQSWFQDPNFRSAVDWAIDREDLILNIFSGLASPLHSAEAINSIFLNEQVAKGHKKDINYALELLKKSGFYQKDGILFDKNNNKVEFELLTNAGNTQREATGVSIKQDLEELGMKVNFKAIEFNSLINKIVNNLDFDCIIMALTSNILEPNGGYNVWTSNGALHMFNKRSSNDFKENNSKTDDLYPFEKELDEIYKKGALEFDFSKRKEIYDKYQEIVQKENLMIYLYSPINISAIRKKVKNIFPSKLGGLIYDKAQIYIEN